MTKSAEISAPRPVRLSLAGEVLNGDLTVPANAHGLVVFAHGSGSSRHSARNRGVADVLHHGGFATLLLDLLTENEDSVDAVTAEFRFDISLLADRLVGAIDWAEAHPDVASLRIGLFGASTGAAAALAAAARRPGAVRAVVSRGGRPDLAEQSLGNVVAPTPPIAAATTKWSSKSIRTSSSDSRSPRRSKLYPARRICLKKPVLSSASLSSRSAGSSDISADSEAVRYI